MTINGASLVIIHWKIKKIGNMKIFRITVKFLIKKLERYQIRHCKEVRICMRFRRGFNKGLIDPQ